MQLDAPDAFYLHPPESQKNITHVANKSKGHTVQDGRQQTKFRLKIKYIMNSFGFRQTLCAE